MEPDLDQILHLSSAEKLKFEKLQNLYSLVKTIEYLYWAFTSGKIEGKVYDSEFQELFNSFKMCMNTIPNFQGVDQFFQTYQLDHCFSAK